MAITKVTMYQTSSGGLFETEHDAELAEVKSVLKKMIEQDVTSDFDGTFNQLDELLEILELGHRNNKPGGKKPSDLTLRRIKLASQFFAWIDLLRSSPVT